MPRNRRASGLLGACLLAPLLGMWPAGQAWAGGHHKHHAPATRAGVAYVPVTTYGVQAMPVTTTAPTLTYTYQAVSVAPVQLQAAAAPSYQVVSAPAVQMPAVSSIPTVATVAPQTVTYYVVPATSAPATQFSGVSAQAGFDAGGSMAAELQALQADPDFPKYQQLAQGLGDWKRFLALRDRLRSKLLELIRAAGGRLPDRSQIAAALLIVAEDFFKSYGLGFVFEIFKPAVTDLINRLIQEQQGQTPVEPSRPVEPAPGGQVQRFEVRGGYLDLVPVSSGQRPQDGDHVSPPPSQNELPAGPQGASEGLARPTN
jgi:hypothetical protein